MNLSMKTSITNLEDIFDFRTTGMTPPNRIIFGCGAVDKIGVEAKALGHGRALLISDAIIEKLGILAKVKDMLGSSGFEVGVFAEVEPEPHVETVEAIYNFGSAKDYSIVVAVGGGSVMDLAKLAAQSLSRKVSPIEYLNRKVVPEKMGLPLILAPTTSGTGSEVSMTVVVAMGNEKRFLSDPHYYPNIAIIDPTLTVSVPPHITANTGMDALSHAIEGMLHKKANPFSDGLCLMSIEMIGAYLRRAVADGKDLEARYYMSFAATVGMMGMIMSGGLYAHSASYVISKFRPTPHGLGCGLALPYTMAYNLPVSTSKLAKIAVALGEQTWMQSQMDAAVLAVDSVVKLMRDVDLPITLEELGGIDENKLEEMASLMISLYPRPMNPQPMGLSESVKFWRNMWEGHFYK